MGTLRGPGTENGLRCRISVSESLLPSALSVFAGKNGRRQAGPGHTSSPRVRFCPLGDSRHFVGSGSVHAASTVYAFRL